MIVSWPRERRRCDFVGGVRGHAPLGNFEKLACLRLHFVRSGDSM